MFLNQKLFSIYKQDNQPINKNELSFLDIIDMNRKEISHKIFVMSNKNNKDVFL